MALTRILAIALTCHLAAAEYRSLFFRQHKMEADSPCPKGKADLESQLDDIDLRTPWLNGQITIPSVGNVFYKFSRARVEQAMLSDMDVTPTEDGLILSVSQGSMSMNAQYIIIIGTGTPIFGNYNLNVMGIQISASLDITTDTDGRPIFINSQCRSQITTTNVDFYGKYQWLKNIFRTRADKSLRKSIEDEICSKVYESAPLLEECIRPLSGESQQPL